MFTRNHTVDKAIAPLLKVQKDFSLVVDERTATIAQNKQRIDGLSDDSKATNTEMLRAGRIALVLANILINNRLIVDPQE